MYIISQFLYKVKIKYLKGHTMLIYLFTLAILIGVVTLVWFDYKNNKESLLISNEPNHDILIWTGRFTAIAIVILMWIAFLISAYITIKNQ